MPDSSASRSHRPITRRLGAATLALAALVSLGACKASGAGSIDEPVDGGPVSVFEGRARFALDYSCKDKAGEARIKGHLTYRDAPSVIDGVEFPAIRLRGTADGTLPAESGFTSCAEAAAAYEGQGAVQFEGTYRAKEDRVAPGRFRVLVFDQDVPGLPAGEFTGDGFAIELIGGGYDGYTRAGYLESGDIQVG